MDDEDDDVELLDNDDDDDARSTVQEPQAKKTNTGKVTTKAKGKAKTEPKGATSVSKANGANGKGRTTEGEDTDGYEDIRPIPRLAPLPPVTAHKPAVSNNSLVKENERLKKQLTAVCDLLLSPLVALIDETLGKRRARRCHAKVQGAGAATTYRSRSSIRSNAGGA